VSAYKLPLRAFGQTAGKDAWAKEEVGSEPIYVGMRGITAAQ
jgi:hypothetical protein